MDRHIILYSTNCPRCNVLAKKLELKGIKFELCTDVNVMRKKGFMTAPMLEVNDYTMKFEEAVKWVDEQED